MEDMINKIKEYMADLNNREFVKKLFILLIITILLLVIVNGFMDKSKKDNLGQSHENLTSIKEDNIIDYSTFLESKLEEILTMLKGVGDVSVMVTLEDSSEMVPATNITRSTETNDETDSEGGTRKTSREEENIQLLELDNDVVILKEIKSNIKGVIVVAEGVENSEVLERVYEAVKTVLGISGNKVEVFPRK